jgi:hypothetical protein
MTVLRMGFPGLEKAVKSVFSIMRIKEVRLFPFILYSNSVIVPRVSGSIDHIKDVSFNGILPIEEKKIITADDLMEFELVELNYPVVVQVYLSTGGSFAVHSHISFPKYNRTIGYFHEDELTASCKEYDSITKVLPLDISNEKYWELSDIKQTLFRVVSTMIPVANLLYSLYNLDNNVKFYIINSFHTPKDEEKIRTVAERVKTAGSSFPEAIVRLGLLHYLI